MEPWGSLVEIERRNRILLSLAAYSYEFLAELIMSDSQFDALAKAIDPSIDTGNPELDNFFKKEFSPSTGMWIYKHPELLKVIDLYHRIMKILPE